MSEKRKNKHFGAAIINEVKEMILMGKTQKEIAEHFGLKDKFVVKQLLKRERAKERSLPATRIPQLKARPRTKVALSEQDKDDEIKRLKMEVELCVLFFKLLEGSEAINKIFSNLQTQREVFYFYNVSLL